MKRVTKVKVCGLREVEHILAAAEAGADFAGMVFAPGKRQITPEKARKMVEAVRKTDDPPALVGVFVNETADEVNRIATECDLDLVQLSGDENFAYCLSIEKPVIKVLHVSDDQTADEVIREIETGFDLLKDRDVLYLLDTKSAEAYGGTGKSFSRQIAAEVARRVPVIIAGGLDPGNVAAMIEEVHPWGVDTSSGIETDGVKDVKKIKEFIDEVKAVAGG